MLESYLRSTLEYVQADLVIPRDSIEQEELQQEITQIQFCELVGGVSPLPLENVELKFYFYQLYEDEPCEEALEVAGGGEDVHAFEEWMLPNAHFNALWDNLLYEQDLKPLLLRSMLSSLEFTKRGINPLIVSFNRYSSLSFTHCRDGVI